MGFGLFYDLQLPKPLDSEQWHPDDEYRLVQETLEQIGFADKLGFAYVFEVEHDVLEEYTHSSAPEVILAAASQRTRNIRLGHGIIHMPPTFNHPIRVAERIATLDLVSNGRVEFGTGEGESVKIRGGRMVGFSCQWHLPRALSIPMQTLKTHNLSLEAVVFTQFPWNLTLSVTN